MFAERTFMTISVLFYILMSLTAHPAAKVTRRCDEDEQKKFFCNHGKCMVEGEKIFCQCEKEFSGRHCETQIAERKNRKVTECNISQEQEVLGCFRHGQCIVEDDRPQCKCESAFHGKYCETELATDKSKTTNDKDRQTKADTRPQPDPPDEQEEKTKSTPPSNTVGNVEETEYSSFTKNDEYFRPVGNSSSNPSLDPSRHKADDEADAGSRPTNLTSMVVIIVFILIMVLAVVGVVYLIFRRRRRRETAHSDDPMRDRAGNDDQMQPLNT